ncbi:hypothetical protein [Paenibacillus xerothermodurans]|uniref:Uncharacterized protein n=1 Tax=Paenibacillus xerothermodurans TaxID=1977292 RepID=A0A2W1N7T6_PAEXE|nr:hypothetical protein [Paenibacillus xerothermodurans]PZE20699.1 hypothetical protein CBW46_011010 [Paenibacillus xerothermodurans]
MGNSKYDTPPPVAVEEDAEYIQAEFASTQQTEHLPPEAKTELGFTPQPIRYFGYFFFASAALMLIIGLVLQCME